ncbi:MAG: PstS family phosphate ABC transporter substrate-binding protein [Prevotellaceae bacterium]|jgi:phosphate transport system substrate-binding protein|nr:PstS family phosphate ABC transporter substrate-binding protein [Prevotellaceae bacterium]
MKQTILAAAMLAGAIFAGALCSAHAQRIKGSDTMLPLSQREAESYMKANAQQTVTVTGGGSGVGISALVEGTTDIAQSSRKIKFDERQRLQASGKAVKEVVAAFDALAIIVHPSNKVQNLTREQLEGIFTGKIRSWKEVGGSDLKIVPYARETSSGTYEFFKESVLKNKSYMNGIMNMSATGAVIQSVSQTAGAIGYVGLAYLSRGVKAIRVSYDGGKSFVEPSAANAKSKAYPISRPLFYYYAAQSESSVMPFIGYVLSEEGQKIVANVGFIPVR